MPYKGNEVSFSIWPAVFLAGGGLNPGPLNLWTQNPASEPLSQLKRRDTVFTGIEGSNFALSDSIQPLNSQIDDPFSGQPEFKKTVSQRGHGFIDEQVSI